MAAMPPSFANCFWLSSPIARFANAATASVSQYASPLFAMSISGFKAPASTILRPFSSCRLSSDAALAANRATSRSLDRSIFTTASRAPIFPASALRSNEPARFLIPSAATLWKSCMSRRAFDDTLDISTNSCRALYLISLTRNILFVARFAMASAAGSLRPAIVSLALTKSTPNLSIAASLLPNSVASDSLATAMRHHFSTSVSSVFAMRMKKNFTSSSTSSSHSFSAAAGSSASLEYPIRPSFITLSFLLLTIIHSCLCTPPSSIRCRTVLFPPALLKKRAAASASFLSLALYMFPTCVRNSGVPISSAHPVSCIDSSAQQSRALALTSGSLLLTHATSLGTTFPDLTTALDAISVSATSRSILSATLAAAFCFAAVSF